MTDLRRAQGGYTRMPAEQYDVYSEISVYTDYPGLNTEATRERSAVFLWRKMSAAQRPPAAADRARAQHALHMASAGSSQAIGERDSTPHGICELLSSNG